MSLATTKEEQMVGARKAAKGILSSLDRRLVEPAGILIRFSGWMLVAFVIYLYIFEVFDQTELNGILLWLFTYSAYLTLLVLVHKYWSQFYDSTGFRVFRIVSNLIIISALVYVASSARFLVAPAYAIPIVATIFYFAEHLWIKLLVSGAAILGLVIGSMLDIDNSLSFTPSRPSTCAAPCRSM